MRGWRDGSFGISPFQGTGSLSDWFLLTCPTHGQPLEVFTKAWHAENRRQFGAKKLRVVTIAHCSWLTNFQTRALLLFGEICTPCYEA